MRRIAMITTAAILGLTACGPIPYVPAPADDKPAWPVIIPGPEGDRDDKPGDETPPPPCVEPEPDPEKLSGLICIQERDPRPEPEPEVESAPMD